MKSLKGKFTLIVSIFIVATIILFFLENYTVNYLNSVGEATALSLLSDNAIQAREAFDNHINYIWKEIDIVDLGLSNMDSTDDKSILSYLKNSLNDAKSVKLILDNDTYIDSDYKTGDIVISSNLYPLIKNNERVCILNQNGDNDTLLFASRLTNGKINDEEIKYIFVEYELDSFINLLSLEVFSCQGIVSVINQKGLVLFHTESKNDINYFFFKEFKDSSFAKNTDIKGFEEFETSVLNGENKALIVKDGSKKIIVSYAKISTLDWYITITANYDVVFHDLNKSVTSVGRRSIFTSIGIIFLSMILVLIISMDIFKERKEKKKLYELNKSLIDTKRVALDVLEAAQNASKYKSIFLSNMSHDIRTPMNAIVGFTSLIEHYYDDKEKVLDYTKKIETSSEHLLNLINNVLDMSKIESGKTTLSYSNESIYEVIDEVNTVIAPQAKKKEQSLNISFHNIVHDELVMDKLRINQIIINILSNSVKYTQKGGKISLDIEEKSADLETANYIITVKDNGIGMSDEYINNLFDSFTREEDDRVNAIEGTGLGMAIVKKIIDLMGGTISVNSHKGQGTTFTVCLPFTIANCSSKLNVFSKNNISKCLIINEKQMNLDNIKKMLRDINLNVNIISNINEYSNYDFDILIINPVSYLSLIEIKEKIEKQNKIIVIINSDFSEGEISSLNYIDGVIDYNDSNFLFKLEQIVIKRLGSINNKNDSFIHGMRFLVAEDNELNIDILKELLSILGASCDICTNGKEAVDRFLSSRPGDYDVIFMDIQMPIMNGYEATKIIRGSEHPMAKKIPIVAMTANAFIEDVKEALDYGMNAHISKPIKINSIIETLKSILENK